MITVLASISVGLLLGFFLGFTAGLAMDGVLDRSAKKLADRDFVRKVVKEHLEKGE